MLVCAVLFQAPTYGWNSAGHEAVAQIALDNLPEGSPARQQVDLILKQDTRNDPGSGRDGTILGAATWPDAIKHRPQTAPHSNIDKATMTPQDPSWHYVDIPYELDAADPKVADLINAHGTKPDPKKDQSGNAVTGLQYYIGHLKDLLSQRKPKDEAAANALADAKADALCWLVHLAGDLHQPMHCVTVTGPLANYTPPERGDEGGNGFTLAGQPPNLHAYWDDQVDIDHASNPRGKGNPHGISALSREEIVKRAKAIEEKHPVGSFAGKEKDLEIAHWALESFADREFAYSTKFNEVPDEDYADKAQNIAQERIALAGYRLAELLKSIFESNSAKR
jgi:hypothetical protein